MTTELNSKHAEFFCTNVQNFYNLNILQQHRYLSFQSNKSEN